MREAYVEDNATIRSASEVWGGIPPFFCISVETFAVAIASAARWGKGL
jgi:hypothetical protein